MLELHSGLPWSNVYRLTRYCDSAMFLEAPEYIQELISLSQGYSYDKEPDYGQFKKVLQASACRLDFDKF